jgi:hypothetical protein
LLTGVHLRRHFSHLRPEISRSLLRHVILALATMCDSSRTGATLLGRRIHCGRILSGAS